MTLDPTQILILAFVGAALMDKAFAWYVVHLLAGAPRAPSFPAPPGPILPIPLPTGPGPDVPPVKPPVVPDKPPPVTPPVPPAPGIPRFTGITTTSFAGVSDSVISKQSAYTGKIIDSNKPGAALPYHFPGTPPVIRVFCRGKTVDCPIVDVGPWNTHDTYWDHGARPQAESGTDATGRHTNRAGLDLTPGAWAALGKTGNLDAITDITSWDFVSVLDKGSVPPVVPPPVGPGPIGGIVLQHNVWPTQAQVRAGALGDPHDKSQHVEVACPWALNGGKTKSITIHKMFAPSLARCLNYIWEHPVVNKSQAWIDAHGYNVFDGSWNIRDIGGTSQLSMHAYAAAMDWNAAKNPQHAPETKTLFKTEKTEPPNGSLIIWVFEQEGWTCGIRWSPAYIDSMHIQGPRV